MHTRLWSLNKSGNTLLHEWSRQGRLSLLKQAIVKQEPHRLREAIILKGVMGLVADSFATIDLLSKTKQTFFPRVQLDDSVRDINTILVETGGAVNLINTRQRTLLHEAVLGRRTHVAQWLLEEGAIPDSVDVFDKTPVEYALGLNDADTTRLFTKLVDPEKKNSVGDTLLHTHCTQVHACVVLMKTVPTDSYGNAPWMRLVERRNSSKALQDWLSLGAWPGFQNKTGRTMLHLACLNGRLDLAQILIAHPYYWRRQRLFRRDKLGKTPWDYQKSASMTRRDADS